jgi:hypothetical protein
MFPRVEDLQGNRAALGDEIFGEEEYWEPPEEGPWERRPMYPGYDYYGEDYI